MVAKQIIQARGRHAVGRRKRFVVGAVVFVMWFWRAGSALHSAPFIASTMRFFLRDPGREYLKSKTMSRMRGRVKRVERLPMISSSGVRRIGPRVNFMVVLVTEVVRGTVLYHMALDSMHKKSEAKQEATRWHLRKQILRVILLSLYILTKYPFQVISTSVILEVTSSYLLPWPISFQIWYLSSLLHSS